MGIDANIYVQGAITDQQLTQAETFLREHLSEDPWIDGKYLRRSIDDQVLFWTGVRYYSPGYERGDWPTIYGYIQAMQGAFPELAVHYGPDYDDQCDEATPERLQELWRHYNASR